MSNIFIIFGKSIYDISKYIEKYPEEKLDVNHHINFYNNMDISGFVNNEKCNSMLIETLLGRIEDNEKLITYICPNHFINMGIIPSYFHYLSNDSWGLSFMKDKENNTFLLRRSETYLPLALSITYKTEDLISQLRLYHIQEKWFCSWDNDNGTHTDYKGTITNIIDKVFIKRGFKPIER